MSERTKTCGNCAAWDDRMAWYTRDGNLGSCRARPPSVDLRPKHLGGFLPGVWPTTAERDWCLEWSPRESQGQAETENNQDRQQGARTAEEGGQAT